MYGNCHIFVTFLSNAPRSCHIFVTFLSHFGTLPAGQPELPGQAGAGREGCGQARPGQPGRAVARPSGHSQGEPWGGPARTAREGQARPRWGIQGGLWPGQAWAPRKTTKPPKQRRPGGPWPGPAREAKEDRSVGLSVTNDLCTCNQHKYLVHNVRPTFYRSCGLPSAHGGGLGCKPFRFAYMISSARA